MKTDYEIRQETEKDYPQVFKLVEEAFRDMEESDHREQFLVERLRHSPAFVPELSLVADEDGGVVGYGLMTRVSIRSGILDAESLALAPVAVRPDRQSMGIGSALIRELHARAARLGYKSAVVLGHEGFYPRFGYRKASDYGIAFRNVAWLSSWWPEACGTYGAWYAIRKLLWNDGDCPGRN